MPTLKVTLEYDGTRYAGWQRQPNRPTIQEAVEAALTQIAQTTVSVVGASRTDAGVHALGQVASFRTDRIMPPEEWTRALNGLLPDDISVRSVEEVDDGFHARYSARGKLYEYRILNRPERSALQHQRAWHVHKPLDMPAMKTAADLLIGKHDFSSFEGALSDNENPWCDLTRLDLSREADLLRIQAYADRFLKQMVRAIVGTLVEVGLKKRAPETLKEILERRDRSAAGKTAPPYGLYLVRVDYEREGAPPVCRDRLDGQRSIPDRKDIDRVSPGSRLSCR
ncbi:MAG TPA: tRNA pseudouridine(38-40) synthase TruA [Nitrospiraceae bacterium]|jgi:tRNA pseudouridine38-40 synthase|nr:tRNA pseudouridine(38-40) synthase TruA [Nitrospiraceae bacterium]